MFKKILIIAIPVLVLTGLIFVLYATIGNNTEEPQTGQGTLSTENKERVEEYVRENISELSPQKAVLGGTFYVTDVVFLDETSARVNYEDGHIALEADMHFTITGNDGVRIQSFEVLEPDEQVGAEESNFRETGNLTETGTTGWTLVYEAPGKPALTASLVFTETSQCREDGVRIPCTPPKWEVGERASVTGTKKGDIVAVHTLELTTERSSVTPPQNGAICEDLCGDGTCQEIVCMGEGCPCPETPQSCPSDCASQ